MQYKPSTRKTFIVDTSVLLYDMSSIHSFPGNDVVIPLIVLDELDRFKDKPGLLGESARYVNRYLDIAIQNDQTIRVDIDTHHVPDGLDEVTGDNKIIGAAFDLKKSSSQPVVMVTKDINFRIKCDSLGVHAEDYYKDRIVHDKSKIYMGQIEIEIDDPTLIDAFYDSEKIDTDSLETKMFENQFVTVKCGNQSMEKNE